ncbi:hypothetical protein PG991_005933 [Apiospora marii]|uniref:Uncharacterized protein n=1 Tax=Apiospora marii TaxID=335849 RepID=A0ABR1SAM5_9PEZI
MLAVCLDSVEALWLRPFHNVLLDSCKFAHVETQTGDNLSPKLQKLLSILTSQEGFADPVHDVDAVLGEINGPDVCSALGHCASGIQPDASIQAIEISIADNKLATHIRDTNIGTVEFRYRVLLGRESGGTPVSLALVDNPEPTMQFEFLAGAWIFDEVFVRI